MPCRAPWPRQPRAGPLLPTRRERPPEPLAAGRATGCFYLRTMTNFVRIADPNKSGLMDSCLVVVTGWAGGDRGAVGVAAVPGTGWGSVRPGGCSSPLPRCGSACSAVTAGACSKAVPVHHGNGAGHLQKPALGGWVPPKPLCLAPGGSGGRRRGSRGAVGSAAAVQREELRRETFL